MKIFNISASAMVWRLHIMTALVVTLGFLGFMYVGIILGMLLFLLTLMGVQWKHIKQLNPFRQNKTPEYEWERSHTPIHLK